jgi:hypothetical protein
VTTPRTFWNEPEHQARYNEVIKRAKRDGRVTLQLSGEEAELLNTVMTAGYREIVRDGAPQQALDTVLAVLNLLDVGRETLKLEAEVKQEKFDQWMEAALVEHVGASIVEGVLNGMDFWELVDSWRRTSDRDEIEFDGPPYPSGRTSHHDPERVRYSNRTLGDRFHLAITRATELLRENNLPVPPRPAGEQAATS